MLALSAPAVAAGHVDNAAATRAYVRAGAAFEQGAIADLAASVAAVEASTNAVGEECPDALTYAPRDQAFAELGEAAGDAMSDASLVPARSLMLDQAHAIEHLVWSNRKLTRLVHIEAKSELETAALEQPNVCADIAAWTASGYATLPRSVTRYVERSNELESLSFVGRSEEFRETVIARMLRRYEDPAERRTDEQTERLEEEIGKRLEATEKPAYAKLAADLGVPAL